MTAYEYMTVVSVYKTNWGDIKALPAEQRPSVEHERVYYLRRPGSDVAEERRTDDGLAILNELGAQGWRVVADTVLDSVVAGTNYYGWSDVAQPVRRTTTLMREVTS